MNSFRQIQISLRQELAFISLLLLLLIYFKVQANTKKPRNLQVQSLFSNLLMSR